MSGNFRSTPAICAAIVMLRPPSLRVNRDISLGRLRRDTTPVHVFSYGGTAVPSTIGSSFRKLVEELDIPLAIAPVLAATRTSAAKAAGHPAVSQANHSTLLLAQAVMTYHFAFAVGNRRDALVNLHRIVLLVQGRIKTLGGYHTYIVEEGLDDGRWRPEVIAIASALRFDPTDTAGRWLDRARDVLTLGLVGSSSIKQRLKLHKELAKVLGVAPKTSPPARTIHSVKGQEFPAVCVVMTTQTAGAILDILEGDTLSGAGEDVRKIYVGASRAQRLLALAVPKSGTSRLIALLKSGGCNVRLCQL
jgi:hypothetical protein